LARRAGGAAWRLGAGLAAIGLVLLGAGQAGAQDVARGRQLFQLCGACHGVAGEGNRLYAAPAIGGLPQWYLEAQLGKFRQGIRAYRAEDVAGLQMRPMARALMTEADVKAVAAYVASLRPASPAATLTGDPERGRAAYAVCVACHGERAKGNQALGAPPLTRQADWYLVAQLGKFRQGLRGTHPRDATGAQMRPMSMTMADDRATQDVVAYIRTLTD
jgi:cytochrome c oxidase subunit 2